MPKESINGCSVDTTAEKITTSEKTEADSSITPMTKKTTASTTTELVVRNQVPRCILTVGYLLPRVNLSQILPGVYV